MSVEYSLSNYSVTGKSIQSMIAYTVKVTGMTLTVTLDSDERLLSDWMHVDDYTKFLVEQFGDVIIRSGEKITFTGDFLYQSTYFPDMYSEEDVKYGFSYVDTDKYVVDKNINEHYTKVTGNLNVKLPKDVNKIELVSEYEYKGAYNTVNEFYNGVKNVKEGSPYIERETDDWYSYTNNLTLKYNGKSCIENYYYRHNYSIDTYLNYVYSYMIKTEEETVASDVSFPSHFFNYSDFAALQAAITSAGLTGGVDTTHPDIAKKNCEELLNRVHTESDNEINVGITIAVVAVLIIVAIGAIWYFNYRE